MKPSTLRGIYLRLAGVVVLVVMLALGASAIVTHRLFEQSLAPQMSKKVVMMGSSVRSLILKAVEYHIEFRELYGVDQTFDDLKRTMPEIASFALTDTKGVILYQRLQTPAGGAEYFKRPSVLAALNNPGAPVPEVRVDDQYIVSLPVVSPSGPLGMLHIGIGVRFVDDIVIGMAYDLLVILVVALFFTLELLHFLAGQRLERSLRSLAGSIDRGIEGHFATPARPALATDFTNVTRLLDAMLARVNESFAGLSRKVDACGHRPAHERPAALTGVQRGLQQLSERYRFGRDDVSDIAEETQIGKIRAPLFVFIVAEEMTRSFLPTFVKSLLVPVSWLSPEIAVGLPITLFMLIVALAQPHLGAYSERVGHRRVMLIGAGVAALGFAATAFSASVVDLLVWRSFCAFGYAMVFVAAQGYVLEHAAPGARARSFAVFVGAIMVATVCGPSIGGILADNIGERLTFGLSAVLAIGAMAAMRQLPGRRASTDRRAPARAPRLAEIGALLINPRFMSLTGLAAMPAKIVLTGICFYLVPLYMLSIGGSQAMTGRLLMSYAVVMVLMSPLTATLASSRARMEWLVGGGLLLSGIGCSVLLAGDGTLWVLTAVLLIGLGQSLSMSAQSALVGEHCRPEVEGIGESALYGVYRLLERMGNALGPLLAGVLLLNFGFRTSFVAIGALAIVCGGAFLLTTRRGRQRSITVPPSEPRRHAVLATAKSANLSGS